VTLAAAALQFPLRQPMITSVVVGMRSRAEVLQNAAWMKEKIDEAFWNELELDLTRD
jgi:D-threo-aldose 1-dehydrogenase